VIGQNGDVVVRVQDPQVLPATRRSEGSTWRSTGEVVVDFGRSGSGKSTLLRCINSSRSDVRNHRGPTGSGWWAGTDEDATRYIRQLRIRAGMVFQQFNLFPH
jgi:ABC-type polar amino acid transport system ATPase subunit